MCEMKRFVVGLFVGMLGVLMVSSCVAAEMIEVMKQEGAVEIIEQDKPAVAVASKRLPNMRYVFKTGATGRAVVRVGEYGIIVVEKNSTVEVDRSSSAAHVFRQVTGMIFYAMNKVRGSMRPVSVKTKTAVLGIRGTRFLVVEQEGRNEVGMRKGAVTVTSPEEEFEIHRSLVENEFSEFKKEARDAIARERREFNAYKANSDREFVEFKREFTLGADRMVSFDGRRVTESGLSQRSKQEIESIESYAAEWIKEVRD